MLPKKRMMIRMTITLRIIIIIDDDDDDDDDDGNAKTVLMLVALSMNFPIASHPMLSSFCFPRVLSACNDKPNRSRLRALCCRSFMIVCSNISSFTRGYK